jgi:hypothetical protein
MKKVRDMPAHDAGKGSDYRIVDTKVFNENMDTIFGKHCPKCSCLMDKLGSKFVCLNCHEEIKIQN